jgi:hypothetical protein
MIPGTQTLPASAFRPAGGLRLLTWPALDAAGVAAAVTARDGGVSDGPYATLNLSLSVGDDPARVLENRRRLAAALDADLNDFVFARQVHGAGVAVVGDADRGSGASSLADAVDGADALVTTAPGVILAILTADCLPVVLHDPVAGVLACVHAGWRGTVAGVTAAAVAALRDLGSHPSDIVAGLGPAIAGDRYQVGPDVREAVTAAFGAAAAAFLRPDLRPGAAPKGADRWLLDLPAANRHALREAGVPAAQIHASAIPTGTIPTGTGPTGTGPTGTGPIGTGPTGTGDFFSDRAARPCGRLALIARLREPMDVTT